MQSSLTSDNKDESMGLICCSVKRCPIIFVDFGVEKCESEFANSIRNVPLDSMKYARML